MGDLLEVDGAAVDPGLVGLSQNGVEGFLHGEIDEGPQVDGAYNRLELLFGILYHRYLLQQHGKERERGRKPLNVTFPTKDIHRQTNIQHALPTQDIFPNPLNNIR